MTKKDKKRIDDFLNSITKSNVKNKDILLKNIKRFFEFLFLVNIKESISNIEIESFDNSYCKIMWNINNKTIMVTISDLEDKPDTVFRIIDMN